MIKRRRKKNEILIRDSNRFRRKSMMNQLLFLKGVVEVSNRCKLVMKSRQHLNHREDSIGILK